MKPTIKHFPALMTGINATPAKDFLCPEARPEEEAIKHTFKNGITAIIIPGNTTEREISPVFNPDFETYISLCQYSPVLNATAHVLIKY